MAKSVSYKRTWTWKKWQNTTYRHSIYQWRKLVTCNQSQLASLERLWVDKWESENRYTGSYKKDLHVMAGARLLRWAAVPDLATKGAVAAVHAVTPVGFCPHLEVRTFPLSPNTDTGLCSMMTEHGVQIHIYLQMCKQIRYNTDTVCSFMIMVCFIGIWLHCSQSRPTW